MSALTYLETEGVVMQRNAQLEEIMVDVAMGLVGEEELALILYSMHNGGIVV